MDEAIGVELGGLRMMWIGSVEDTQSMVHFWGGVVFLSSQRILFLELMEIGLWVLLGVLEEDEGRGWGGEIADIGVVYGGVRREKREVVGVSFKIAAFGFLYLSLESIQK